MNKEQRRDPQGTDEAYRIYFESMQRQEPGLETDLEAPPLQIRLNAANALIRLYKDYPGHLYADGAPLQQLRNELDSKASRMAELGLFLRTEGPRANPDYARYYPLLGNDRNALGFIALDLLLSDSAAQLDRLAGMISTVPDWRMYLVDLLVHAFCPARPLAKKYKADKYQKLWAEPVVRALALPAEQRAEALARYMNYWGRIMRPWGWKPKLDLRLDGDALFSDFAFEVALAVCAYDIDDSSFRDHPYYPADLVTYYRANLRHTRDAWRAQGAGAGVEIVAPPPPPPADLAKSKRKGIARWLELVCDGDNEAVESTLEVIGKPKKLKELDELLEALGSTHALRADMKDDDTVVDTLSQMAAARGLAGFDAPADPPSGPARCSAALLAFAGWVEQHGYTALALDDGWDNWVAVLVRSAYRDELLQLSGTLGIAVRGAQQAWTA